MTALDDIRERLAAATPGPWEATDVMEWDRDGAFELAHVITPNPHDGGESYAGVAMGILRPDAEFIANAPTDIARLLRAVEAVEKVADELAAHSEGRALDYTDEDFERGWHGANRAVVAQIRAALAEALGGAE